jgi:hypothetical protein
MTSAALMTCDNLRVHRLVGLTVLQQREGSDPWCTLRPVRVGDTPCFLVGAFDRWYLYALDVLIPHLLANEFNPAHPLPAPMPVPDSFPSLPEQVRWYFVRYGLGDDLPEVMRALGVTDESALVIASRLKRAGLAVLRNQETSTDLARHEYTYRQSLMDVEAVQHPDEPDQPQPHRPDQGTIHAPPPAHGVVSPITDELRNRLSRRLNLASDASHRVSWPFRDLKPRTQVSIPKHLAAKGQRAALVYARRKGWAVRTHRDPATGVMYVLRLEDPVEE